MDRFIKTLPELLPEDVLGGAALVVLIVAALHLSALA